MIEIIIAGAIACVAVYIFVKSIRKKSTSGCDCGSCSSKCPSYKDTKK